MTCDCGFERSSPTVYVKSDFFLKKSGEYKIRL